MDQISRELKSLEDGRLRYLKRQTRVEEDQGAGSREANLKMTQGLVEVLASSIESHLSHLQSSEGKRHGGLMYLRELDPLVLSRLTLNGLWNSCARQDYLQTTLVSIGRLVETEVWALALEDHNSDLFDRLVSRVSKVHGSLKYRLKAIRSTAAKQGFKPEAWPEDTRILVAGPLVNSALKGLSHVFEMTTIHKGRNKTYKAIQLTQEALEELTSIEDMLSWMKPMFSPMVTRPKPWEAFDSGCYHTPELASRVPLVRTRDKARKAITKQAISDGIMAPCLEALNIIQDTPWSINKPIFEIVSWAWAEGKVLSKFPRSRHLPLPERPEDYESLPESYQKGWRLKRSGIISRNRGIDSERITVLQDLQTASELSQYPCFWIPHSLDFRGRVYPVCHFNQQRADYVKAMMQFSIGKPLGDYGAYWLAIHLANSGDFEKVSKRSLDDRVRWVEDNIGLIEDIASDPKGTFDIWSEADKPFQFLAACLDFAGYLKDGPEHVSHLPVALDGSNSGLQHYSAALRSPEGSLVNLTPSSAPADIYQAVADLVTKRVSNEAAQGDPLAILCLENGISRSLVKRNVMTFAYSSGQYGFKQQLLSDLMQPLAVDVLAGEREVHPYASVVDEEGRLDDGYRAAGYLAKHIWGAVNQIVKQAGEGMRFFQQCAQALAHESKPLLWYTPVGLPVLHRYDEYNVKRIKLFLHDKAITVPTKSDRVNPDGTIDKPVRLEVRTSSTGMIDKRKARNAVAPNVIHSLDAAHLMLTVLDAKDAGIASFCLIHDSFGTHAADTPVFFDIIRHAFVNMYTSYDPFEVIRQETYEALDDKQKVPSVPAKGSLDLSEVIESLYAFA